jgi:VanZ family protein
LTQEGIQKRSKFLSRYLPLVAWLAFISYASSDSFSAGNTSRIIGPLILWLFPNTSQETLAVIHLVTRKLAHFTEYAILGYLAARAFRGSPRAGISQRWFLISLVLIVVYALIDEYHQSFVPTRTGSVFDSLIDMAGGLTALMVIRRKSDEFSRKSTDPNPC